ncbi:MAG: glycosyltransferase [Niabella sp.]
MEVKKQTNKEVGHYRYAVIVPCYNEEMRFPFYAFYEFAKQNRNLLLCLVNDGSKDNTLAVLRGLQATGLPNICVYDLARNSGKSEAVRQGILYVYEKFSPELIGFLDADIATHPEEWLQMAKYKEKFPQFFAIVGSRIQRLGANISRTDNRSFFSSIIKKIIRSILKTRFQDTQCGAKIFHRSLIPFLFNKPFMSPWLFDVEIFLRLQKKFGQSTLHKGVLEFPLMQWTEIGDSRLKMKHMIKIPMQLFNMHFKYNIEKKLANKIGYLIFKRKTNFTVLKQS